MCTLVTSSHRHTRRTMPDGHDRAWTDMGGYGRVSVWGAWCSVLRYWLCRAWKANNAPVQLQGFNLHTTSKHWLVQKIWRSSNRSTFIEIDDRFVGCFQGWTGIPSNQTSWCYILTIQHNLERRRTFCWKVITISDFDGFSWGHDCCDITVTSIQHE